MYCLCTVSMTASGILHNKSTYGWEMITKPTYPLFHSLHTLDREQLLFIKTLQMANSVHRN